MIERLMSGVLTAYDQLVADHAHLATGHAHVATDHAHSDTSLNQLRSLQLLFDLKFLANILASGRDDSEVHGLLFSVHFWLKWFQMI